MLHQNVPAAPTSVGNVEDTSSQATATKQETPPTRCPNQGVERGRISLQKSWINTNNTADDEEKSGGQAPVDNGESPEEIYFMFQLIRRSSSIAMYKICFW